MSRRSREKRVTLRGACEPVDNDEIERAFAELRCTQRQLGVDMDAVASNAEEVAMSSPGASNTAREEEVR